MGVLLGTLFSTLWALNLNWQREFGGLESRAVCQMISSTISAPAIFGHSKCVLTQNWHLTNLLAMLRQLFSATSRDKCIKHAQNDDKCVVNVCRCRGKCKKGKISNDAKMVSTGRTVVHISMRSDPIRADPTCHRHIKRHMAALSLALYGHSTDISNIYYVCLFVLPACVFGKWFQPAAAMRVHKVI